MMRIALVISLLICLSLPSRLSGQQARFDHANELLMEQKVEEALEIYRSIERDGQLSGKLFYNMGLSAVHRDSLGLAKFYFLRASGFPEIREEALEGVSYVNRQFNRRSSVLPSLPWERLYDWLADTFGPFALLAGGLLLLNVGVGGIISSWFTVWLSPYLRRVGYGLSAAALLLISTSLLIEQIENRYDTGVMVHKQAVVYEQPQTDSAKISSAYEGYTMTVDQKKSREEEHWYRIRLENGMNGWIEREWIRVF